MYNYFGKGWKPDEKPLFALYWPLQVIANPRALKTLPTPSIPFLRNRAPTIPK